MTGYSALIVEHAGSQVIQFFVSEYISTEANLFVILVITILAVPLFTIADIHYGSGTSRNICGKKKLAMTENKSAKCEPTSSSQEIIKNTGKYISQMYCEPTAVNKQEAIVSYYRTSGA